MKAFAVGYSDTEVLTKLVGGKRRLGWILHFVNGAVFGGVYAVAAARMPGPPVAKGIGAGIGEHLATWPLTRLVPGVDLWGNHRAFWQAVWRHVLFGAILGTLEARLNEGYADRAPA